MRTKGEQRRRKWFVPFHRNLLNSFDYHQLRQVLIKLVVRLSVDKTRICGVEVEARGISQRGGVKVFSERMLHGLEKMTAICGA